MVANDFNTIGNMENVDNMDKHKKRISIKCQGPFSHPCGEANDEVSLWEDFRTTC